MGEASRDVAYPSTEQIIDINRQMIKKSGGLFVPPHNLINRNSLEFILDAIADPAYSQLRFPSLKQKATAIAFKIITAHVFWDGNKRTAIHTAWEFLQANSHKVILNDDTLELASRIASGSATDIDLLEWLHAHQAVKGCLPRMPRIRDLAIQMGILRSREPE